MIVPPAGRIIAGQRHIRPIFGECYGDPYPAAVLGSRAAARIDLRRPGVRVWLGGQWFAVVGILDPVPLAPELDSAALIGWPAAQSYVDFDGHPTTVYTRATESQVSAVRAVGASRLPPAQAVATP